MSKFDQAIETYIKSLNDKAGVRDVNVDLLRSITKSLGPSIYNQDAAKVACSDKKELSRIKESFLIDKLGLDDDPSLDEAIDQVCETLGRSNRNKYRAVFYYLLVQRFEKQHLYIMEEADTTQGQEFNEEPEMVHDVSSKEIIDNYALYAAGFGLIPIPVVDLVSITAVQYNMIKKIAGNYPHVSFDDRKAKSIIAAIVGGIGSLELGLTTRVLFKGVPFFGPLIGGAAVSGFAYYSTKLIGQIFDDHFASGGDLTIGELTMKRMKETFDYEVKKRSSAS